MPPVPASAHDHAAWMAATLDGRFYLAWLGFDEQKLRGSQCILRYSPDPGTWETVYQETSSRRRARNEEAAGLPSVFLTHYPSGKNESLFGRFVSPLGETRLCSDEEGAKFRSVRIDSQDLTVALAVREMVAGAAAHYALFAEEGRNALRISKLQIRSRRWKEISLPVQSRGRVSPEPSHIPLTMAGWCSQPTISDKASISGRWRQTAKRRRVGPAYSPGVARLLDERTGVLLCAVEECPLRGLWA